jgi:hypothetical protein
VGGKSWISFVDTFILFGDPAMEIGLPKPKVAAILKEGEATVFPPEISATPPKIAIEVEGQDFVDGDFVASEPTFLITIRSKDEIELSSIRLLMNDKKFTIFSPEVFYALNDLEANEVNVQFSPILHPSRYHKMIFKVEAENTAGQSGNAQISFFVADSLMIEKVLNYPNPMKDKTDFTFVLSKPAFVTIKIYTVTGRLIKSIEKSAKASYNEIFWDGAQEDGKRVANGVYLYKVIAEDGEEKISLVEKLVVIR